MSEVQVIHGDCISEMRRLKEAGVFVDAIVTDPPYHLGDAGFMGKAWDSAKYGVAFQVETWKAAYDLLLPGGYLVAFGGTRTYHRMACAIEDAGFEVRDSIGWLHAWVYGTGFPKSHNLPGGLGTALKPAWEPVVLVRKPLSEPTVAANVLKHSTGALNIDACRIPGAVPVFDRPPQDKRAIYGEGLGTSERTGGTRDGRWPANVIHDGSDEVLEAFAEQGRRAGVHGPGAARDVIRGGEYEASSYHLGGPRRMHRFDDSATDQSSPARFFYSAKASKQDRCNSKHPTVKPVSLMRWLSRLVCPPGGTILDPFAGSGTTGAAAHAEGFNAILIEREAEYVADIHRRIAALDTKATAHADDQMALL